MRTLEYLHDPELLRWFAPALLVGLGVAVMGGMVSVLVVVRRLALVGQGVSHAAFGAVGVGAAAGIAGGVDDSLPAYLLVVGGFCVAAALGMAWMSEGRGSRFGLREDTVIGVFLVASMAIGAVLLKWRARTGGGGAVRSIESWLFGDMLGVGFADAWVAWGAVALVGGALWMARRHLVFWVFDEAGAEAFGVRVGLARALLLTLLALVIVVSMKLAGVLLATALMVLPGATALRVTDRLWVAQAVSMCAAVLGVLGGLVLSFELDWAPPGPSIVLVQVALLALAWPLGRVVRGGRRRP